MQHEIEIGEYIRTSNGKIDKVINNNYYINWYIECEKGVIDREMIAKHSKDIIDLIEEDDYVNGERVLCFRNSDCDYDIGTEYSDEFGEYFGVDAEDIRTIVTKEQFTKMEYKVGV